MKISDPIFLRNHLLGLAIIGGLCQSASATVISLPAVPQPPTTRFGAGARNESGSAGGDISQIGVSTAGPFSSVNLVGSSSVATFAPSTSHPFTFSYDPNAIGSPMAHFTIGGSTLNLSVSGLIPGSSFVLELINAGTSTTVSGLSLADFGGGAGPSILAGYDTTYTTLLASSVWRIPTTALSGGFQLAGNFSFNASNGSKNGFRVFVESPVPEPATFAFGTALIGGLVLCESRRRRKGGVRQ